jgi:peptidyl-prolyl cis-trans isomerase SurA
VTPNRLRSRANIWVGLAVASTVLLTGCDATPAFNPGVAARVGAETISVSTVDDVSTSYCEAAEQQFEEGQALAQGYLRGQVAGNLALRSAADQFAAELGVTADAEYDEAADAARASLAALTEDQQQAVIDVQGASTYVGAIEKSAGEQLLDESGENGGEKAAREAGQEAFVAWLDDHDVTIDPRFGVTIADGQAVPADTSLSFALSDIATKADAGEPDPEYAATLPEPQRCG